MKRVLVTGANKGIGLAVVERLVKDRRDTFVYLGSRDVARGDAAKLSLVARDASYADRVRVLQIDVANEASVAAAASTVAAEGSLYGLVNNAGIASGTDSDILAVNLFSVKRVVDAFLPALQTDGRIVNISSGSAPLFVAKCSAARQQEIFTNKEIAWEQIATVADQWLAAPALDGMPPRSAGTYGFSKALLNCYTMWLAATSGRVVNACTPGFIITDLTRGMEASGHLGGTTLEKAGALPPEKSTVSTWKLLFGELQGSGHYYGSDGLRSPLQRYRSPGDPEYTGE